MLEAINSVYTLEAIFKFRERPTDIALMDWVCYNCGGPAKKTETSYPEKVTTVTLAVA
jgi:hypothetical protein